MDDSPKGIGRGAGGGGFVLGGTDHRRPVWGHKSGGDLARAGYPAT